jgi:drug/metabolite transporter (DMT)-like permease
MSTRGALLCLASGTAFGTMGIFGKLAYDEGATVGTLLALRFSLAAVLFWALVAATGGLSQVRALSRRYLAAALALGAIGYSAQAGAYFTALRRLDASLLALILYTFPAIVTVAAIVLGRERADRRRIAALALASSGLVLVLAVPGTGALDPLGTALGLGAALIYSTYILTSERVVERVSPLLLSALVCTGAAVTLTFASAAGGDLDPGAVSPTGLGWLLGIVVVSTVGAVSLFFAGLERVGPSAASILSTAEPVVTVVLAFLVFGESLGPLQLAGGALVVGAVFVLNVRSRDAEPLRLRSRLAPRSHAELAKDRRDVVPDRLLGQEEPLGDVGVA